jgi:hypothetical protein
MFASSGVVIVVFALALAASAPGAADSPQTARITARFTPERLGSATAVSFGFATSDPDGGVPSPLMGVEIGYPSNLGFITSGLGVAACSPIVLETTGPAGCPPDSRMGFGSALAELPIGPEVVSEKVQLRLFAGPSPDGHLHVLVYASGLFPVIAQVVMSGVLLAGHLDIVIPPIPGLPAGPYVTVAEMQLTLGGHLTYYERVGGRTVAYHPPGVGLPRHCPRGGFPFSATFAFSAGSSSYAHTAVPCPPRR